MNSKPTNQPPEGREDEKDIGKVAISKFEQMPFGVQSSLKKADWCVGFCHGAKYASPPATVIQPLGLQWVKNKPEFKEECAFVTATKYTRNDEDLDWNYSAWQIKKLDGENDKGEYGWYFGVLNGDGEEWGDIEDLRADFYYILPNNTNDSTPPPQPLGIDVSGKEDTVDLYKSPYQSGITYKSDKNFMVRLVALINKKMRAAGYKTYGDEFERFIAMFDNAEKYLFESRTDTRKIRWGVKRQYPRQYQIWINIKRRCFNVKNKDYKYYGGRGIILSEEFKYNFQTFFDHIITLDGYDKWLNDPDCNLSLDRTNNNGNYERGNMRFADRITQTKNRRSKKEMKRINN